jgi:hypothetical protein
MKRLPQSELETLAKAKFKQYIAEQEIDFPKAVGRLILGTSINGSLLEYEFYVSGWQRNDAVTLARVVVDQVTGEGVVEVFPEYFSEDTWPAIAPPGQEGAHGYWRGIS